MLHLYLTVLQSSGPVRNVIVAIACAALVLIHLVVGIIVHKMDYLDSVRLRQVPLCGPPGLYQYRVLVKTGWRRGAGQWNKRNENYIVKCQFAYDENYY